MISNHNFSSLYSSSYKHHNKDKNMKVGLIQDPLHSIVQMHTQGKGVHSFHSYNPMSDTADYYVYVCYRVSIVIIMHGIIFIS